MNWVTSRPVAADHLRMRGHRRVDRDRRRARRRPWRSPETPGPGRAARSHEPASRSRRRRCGGDCSPASSSIVVGDLLLQRMLGSTGTTASVGQPLIALVTSMPLCLPLQFICSGVRSATCAQHRLGGGTVERKIRGVGQRPLVEAGGRQDPPARLDVHGRAVVAGAHQRQQFGRQLQTGAHHRHRLHRLVRRARVDRCVGSPIGELDLAGRRRDRRPRRSAPTRRIRCVV